VGFLHGGLANSDYLGDQARLLARAHRVNLVDSRGHGRSTRDQRPLGYELTADDVVALLNLLKIEKAAIVGAQAVCVGTQLVASAESAASAEYKQRLVSAHGEDTTVTAIFGPEWPDAPMRVLRNRAVARAEQGAASLRQPVGKTLVFGQPYQMPANGAVLPTTHTQGDHEEICLAAGAGVGAVRANEPAEQIVQSVMERARATIRRMEDVVR
jgi:NAD(P)H-dependent flavin oxidoreductase YrpB (nitropropane dioxygenase family)